MPYRNSVLTMVLRDSLGGNTRTVMVAAVAPEAQHMEESISTCRFAQRVAMISNRCAWAESHARAVPVGRARLQNSCASLPLCISSPGQQRTRRRLQVHASCQQLGPTPRLPHGCRVEVNEELDLEVAIKRFKAENALLRQELQLLRSTAAAGGSKSAAACDGEDNAVGSGAGVEQRHALTEAEQHVLRRQVAAFVEDPSPDAALNVEASMLFIRAAFDMLKGMARAGGPRDGAPPLQQLRSSPNSSGSSAGAGSEVPAELRSLRQLVQQQEQQIGVLVGVLRKQGLPAPGGHTASAGPHTVHSGQSSSSSSSSDGGQVGSRAAFVSAEQATSSRRSSTASVSSTGVPNSPATAGKQHIPPLLLPQPAWPAGSVGAGSHQARAGSDSSSTPLQHLPVPAYSDELLADQHKAVRCNQSYPRCSGCCRGHAPHADLFLPLWPVHPTIAGDPKRAILQFEYFCATSPAHDPVAEQKAVLRERYDAARALGAQVCRLRRRGRQHGRPFQAARPVSRSHAAPLHGCAPTTPRGPRLPGLPAGVHGQV